MNTVGTPLAQSLTEAEREAIHDWLAGSLRRPQVAKDLWRKGGIATLALGRRFSAVRLTEPLVYAVTAAGTLPETVTRVLAAALHGPVIHDPQGRRFYALTPPAEPTWGLGQHAEYLGSDTYLGVPPVEFTDPADGLDCYWAVPMTRPGHLCDPVRLAALVTAGTLELRGAQS
ncbi:hypothetical protein AB0451_18490 [Streptomyces sp. NPDC052000]|uniref:hypothetical protein n=1 Tax=Streptomyces sp. NPDC052000 TaxID=3155676 RepID=UPI00344F55EC